MDRATRPPTLSLATAVVGGDGNAPTALASPADSAQAATTAATTSSSSSGGSGAGVGAPLQRQTSLLPGEVRTPSFIVTMNDWAAPGSTVWDDDDEDEGGGDHHNANATAANAEGGGSAATTTTTSRRQTPLTGYGAAPHVWSTTTALSPLLDDTDVTPTAATTTTAATAATVDKMRGYTAHTSVVKSAATTMLHTPSSTHHSTATTTTATTTTAAHADRHKVNTTTRVAPPPPPSSQQQQQQQQQQATYSTYASGVQAHATVTAARAPAYATTAHANGDHAGGSGDAQAHTALSPHHTHGSNGGSYRYDNNDNNDNNNIDNNGNYGGNDDDRGAYGRGQVGGVYAHGDGDCRGGSADEDAGATMAYRDGCGGVACNEVYVQPSCNYSSSGGGAGAGGGYTNNGVSLASYSATVAAASSSGSGANDHGRHPAHDAQGYYYSDAAAASVLPSQWPHDAMRRVAYAHGGTHDADAVALLSSSMSPPPPSSTLLCVPPPLPLSLSSPTTSMAMAMSPFATTTADGATAMLMLSDVWYTHARHFPPPPPPPLALLTASSSSPPSSPLSSRHARAELWYSYAYCWDVTQRLPPPPRSPLQAMARERQLRLPDLTCAPYHMDVWLYMCHRWFAVVLSLFDYVGDAVVTMAPEATTHRTDAAVVFEHAITA